MRQKLPAVLLGFASAAWALGCAQPPTARVEAAKERLAAVAPEAATYAPAAYKAAQDTAAQLDAEVAAQQQRFALVRSYTRAEELATSVESAADSVRQAIDAEKTRLRTETGRLIADATGAVTSTRQLLDALPARQIPQDQGAAWQSDLARVETSLEEVNKLLAGDELAEAHRQAESALKAASQVGTSVAGLQAEIQEAREAAVARAARGDVTIPRAVSLDGKPLAAGTYSLRLAEEAPSPAGTERWVEFLSDGTVAGRGLAVVIPDASVREVAKSPAPRNEARVEELRGGEYIRVWLNRNGVNYLVHMPTGRN